MTTRSFCCALLATFFVFIAGAPATASGLEGAAAERWTTSLQEALAKAAEGDRLIFVDLYAEWCGWCKVLEEKVFSSPEFQSYTKDFVLLRVDVDDDGEGSMLQARYGVRSLPTSLVVSSTMAKVGQIGGYAPKERFLQALDGEVEAYKRYIQTFENLRSSDRPEVLRMVAESALQRGDGVRAAEAYEALLPHLGSTEEKARVLLDVADSHRLGRQFDAADNALDKARQALGGGGGEHPLIERLDLLSFQIAFDRRDCENAKASIRHFLAAHPLSSHGADLRRALAFLQRDNNLVCA